MTSDTQQLIKNFKSMLLTRGMPHSEREAEIARIAREIAPDVIPMICGGLTIPWTSMQAPVGMFGDKARCAQARSLRTRFELARLLDEPYYPEFATKLAAELSEMDREVAFYIIVMPMGILGDKICLATRYAEVLR